MSSIIFDERPESRSWNLAKNEGVLEYQLIGLHNAIDVLAYAEARVPLYFNFAWLQDIQVKPQGNLLWYVTCPYGPLPKMPGSIEIHSRTTGGSVHITSSREMVAKYGTGAPDTVIIGQDGNGADITVPLQMRSYTFNFARGLVTEALMDYWEDLVGLVNSAPWHNRPAGEVLFLGHDAKTTLSADPASAVTFDFAMTRNRTNFAIGNIVGISKRGHDLLDVHTKTVAIAGQDVQQEKFVYVQRVYDTDNFADRFGF